VLDCVAGFPRARLVVPAPTAITTVTVSQVDLGGEKNIKQIIIHNRTDCCVNRLSNYQVSISNKADFSTHTYQQDFHVAPNPKKIIQQGRYVRIQLFDSHCQTTGF
jgi:hypothetical protein